ncbi:MAG TPA: PAS domain S-box protein [Pyrinomonadaceae bacterium]|nr:PAS domain S-box protein [Pyrinomonadaceae bacterium]
MNEKPLQIDLIQTQLIDAGVEGILAFDRECRYIAWNKGMERISGLKREDVLGKSAFEVFPFLRESGEDKLFYAALAGETATSQNKPYTVPESGRAGFYIGHYSPLFDQHHQVIGGIAVIQDITERKRAEEAAQEAHQRLAFHVENSPLAVIEWDSDFRVSRWSASAERVFGWTADEVIGKHVSEWHFVFDEDVDAVAQVTYRQRVGAELLGVQRNRNYTKAGSILYCEWYNSVLHDEHGELISVLSLVLDVTARKHAEEERAGLLTRERDLRQQAEEADRLKDEFLATLSHELRTPLTSILGWAMLIRNGEVDRMENLDRAFEIIERNARSQARLIDDLLDVSRIITGNLQLDVRPLNLAPIVDVAVDALRPAADAKGIEIHKELDTQTCLVSGDANRLRQVIWNLLMNAIKFTPRGGRVALRLECFKPVTSESTPASAELPTAAVPGSSFPSFVRFTVTDTGEGITPEFLPYVFHRFRQEEGSISRKAGGLGLGLAVVRHLVELHGGSVSADSPGPGQGSSFTVDLPLARDRRHPPTEADKLHEDGRESFERRGTDRKQFDAEIVEIADEVADASAIVARNAAGLRAARPLAGIRVLLVEDDDDSRNLLSLILERHGAEVVAASSSIEALDSFLQRAPNIVISDIGMTEGDGYELIRKLRSLPVQGSLIPALTSETDAGSLESEPISESRLPALIPAIALTGYATSKDRERALAAGYQLHIAKPVEPEDLITAIVQLVAAAKA